MRYAVRAAVTLLTIMAAGCLTAACSSPPAPAASAPPPKDAAKIGVPFRVVEGGAAAEVTLTKITYTATRPDGTHANADEYAVLHIEIVGESARPFSVDLEDFYYQYTQQPDPYQPDDSNLIGVDPVDWSEFPKRLPVGPVPRGKEISGSIPLNVSSQSLMLISMSTSDSTPVVQWLATSH